MKYLAHLVGWFACNARLIVNVSSNPWVFTVKLMYQKPRIKSSSKQTIIAS